MQNKHAEKDKKTDVALARPCGVGDSALAPSAKAPVRFISSLIVSAASVFRYG